MKKLSYYRLVTFVTLMIITISCDDDSGYVDYKGTLPETPVNLADFNTEYDDYNSTAPSLGDLIPFCFSTNRRTRGEEFDIYYLPMNVNFIRSTGVLTVKSEYDNWLVLEPYYRDINDAVIKIRTTGNEFGPHLLLEPHFDEYKFTLLYSTDITGNAQINYVTNSKDKDFSDPKEVNFLNSEHDDMYPAFNWERSRIYFCSNREGEGFDFYYVDVDPQLDNNAILSDETVHEVIKENFLSSEADDKCPFIYGNMMVFTSNRAGGFGGYDLYYSHLVNGEWTAPVNFGDKINTEHDEYRPILINEGVSETQTMMVFSSNRPGGEGGFDLYFVGIKL